MATWTTNVTNAYSGGLALSNLLGFDETKFKITTGIAGAVGTLLAAFGLLNAFQGFLSLMSALIPPLAGVIIADYWIVGKGKKENLNLKTGVSAAGLISFVVGALLACITGGTFASFSGLVEAMPFLNVPFFVGPVNGIVVSLVLYTVLAKVLPKKAEIIIQSPMGGEITAEAILAKVGEVDSVYVRVDVNKAYWVKGNEYGSVDLW